MRQTFRVGGSFITPTSKGRKFSFVHAAATVGGWRPPERMEKARRREGAPSNARGLETHEPSKSVIASLRQPKVVLSMRSPDRKQMAAALARPSAPSSP